MTRDEYINSVLSQVEDKSARAEIEAELNAHLMDRIEYYTNAGFSFPEAEAKALSRMGDGEETGYKIGRLHSRKLRIAFVIFAVVTLLFEVAVNVATMFFGTGCYDIDTVTMEFILFTTIFVLLYYSLKKKSIAVPIALLIVFSIFAKWHTLQATNIYVGIEGLSRGDLSSGIVLAISYLLSGKTDFLKIIETQLTYATGPVWLEVLSIIFYCFTLISIIVVLVGAVKRNQQASFKRKHIRNIFTKAMGIFAAVLFLFGFVNAIICYRDYTPKEPKDMVYVLQSDEPFDFTKKRGGDYVLDTYGGHLDFSKYLYYDESVTKSEFTLKQVNNDFSYITQDGYTVTKTDKSYIYVTTPNRGAVWYDVDYDESNWIKIDDTITVDLPFEKGEYPINIIRLKIEKTDSQE